MLTIPKKTSRIISAKIRSFRLSLIKSERTDARNAFENGAYMPSGNCYKTIRIATSMGLSKKGVELVVAAKHC